MSVWKQKAGERKAAEMERVAVSNAVYYAKIKEEALKTADASKTPQQREAEAERAVAKHKAEMAAFVAKIKATAAKTPEEREAEIIADMREYYRLDSIHSTEEWSRHPNYYKLREQEAVATHRRMREEKRIREGGHPEVNLNQGFPSLGASAGAGGGK